MPRDPSPGGLIKPGNLDMSKRPHVKNKDGSTSTVRSLTVTDDKNRGWVIPTVSDDGRIMSNSEATDTWKRTGHHLGVFSNESDANRFAEKLHESEARKLSRDAINRRLDKTEPKKHKRHSSGGFMGAIGRRLGIGD